MIQFRTLCLNVFNAPVEKLSTQCFIKVVCPLIFGNRFKLPSALSRTDYRLSRSMIKHHCSWLHPNCNTVLPRSCAPCSFLAAMPLCTTTQPEKCSTRQFQPYTLGQRSTPCPVKRLVVFTGLTGKSFRSRSRISLSPVPSQWTKVCIREVSCLHIYFIFSQRTTVTFPMSCPRHYRISLCNGLNLFLLLLKFYLNLNVKFCPHLSLPPCQPDGTYRVSCPPFLSNSRERIILLCLSLRR